MTLRKGRPPLDAADPSVKVTISLPSKAFDAFCALARRQDMSVPEVIRRALYRHTFDVTTKNTKK
jgi:hypothetical protein